MNRNLKDGLNFFSKLTPRRHQTQHLEDGELLAHKALQEGAPCVNDRAAQGGKTRGRKSPRRQPFQKCEYLHYEISLQSLPKSV